MNLIRIETTTSTYGCSWARPFLKCGGREGGREREVRWYIYDHPHTVPPHPGHVREEDLVVLLSERAALHIWQKWIDTLQVRTCTYCTCTDRLIRGVYIHCACSLIHITAPSSRFVYYRFGGREGELLL